MGYESYPVVGIRKAMTRSNLQLKYKRKICSILLLGRKCCYNRRGTVS